MSAGAAGYNAAKHGVVGLMRYFATSLAEKNIRVNSVHPGGVATPMIINEATATFVAETGGFGVGQQSLMDIPAVEPDYVSDAMVYLCGATGRYLTGITLPVDGGLTAQVVTGSPGIGGVPRRVRRRGRRSGRDSRCPRIRAPSAARSLLGIELAALGRRG